MITFAAITPHPPIIIPGIGQQEDLKKAEKTVESMKKLGKNLEKINPDTILIISPHAPLRPDCFMVNSASKLKGSLANFGLKDSFVFENNLKIIEAMEKRGKIDKISLCFGEEFLDHGALVPLHYLTKKIKPRLVHLAFSLLNPATHLEYGKMIGRICAESSEKIAVIASGDLSHRLSRNAPAGYSPRGKIFDNLLKELLSSKDTSGILNLDKELVEEAGECGLRSIMILLGILEKQNYKFKLLSYEAPFGVGYMVARLI